MQAFSVYLHIPFCQHRCAYCDFNTYAGLEYLVDGYVTALCQEIKLVGSSGYAKHGEKLPVHTVFFGGGTPSLLPENLFEKILATLRHEFAFLPNVEITLEANPGTVSAAYLQALAGLGVNRLSLGMQSANPFELRMLERTHSLEEVVQAIHFARQAGITNFNLDLIFGLPSQSLDSWRNNLSMALSMQPPHLALYSLTLEHGTPMAHWVDRGLLPEPDNNLAAEMYEFTIDRLSQANYTQYEISNWAKSTPDGRSYACRHNLQYWRGLPWLGLGAGAHGYIPGLRTVNQLSPLAYIRHLSQASEPLPFPQTPATADLRRLSDEDELGEFMMMAMRLTDEGVSEQDFSARFGKPLAQVFPKQITRLLRKTLVEWTPDKRLRLTRQGRLLGNQVFAEFI